MLAFYTLATSDIDSLIGIVGIHYTEEEKPTKSKKEGTEPRLYWFSSMHNMHMGRVVMCPSV